MTAHDVLVGRSLAVLTGIAGGVALGVPLSAGRPAIVPALAVAAIVIWRAVLLLVPLGDRRPVARIGALALATHVAVAVVLNATVSSAGRPGFLFGDDANYYFLARGFALWIAGTPETPFVPPFWNGDAYLFGTWVYLESLMFVLFGPEVLLMFVLNGAALVLAGLFCHALARQLFGRSAALITFTLIQFWPSLVLWSALNLKDTLAILLLTIFFWVIARHSATARLWPIVIAVAVILLTESLRRYLFVGLSLLLPLGVGLAAALPRVRRIQRAAATALVTGFLLAANQAVSLGPGLVATLEVTRQGMALNARTGYIERPVYVEVGATFIVPTAPPNAARPSPPRTVFVPPEARVVVGAGEERPGTVRVNPGDTVIVGPPGTSPTGAPRVLATGQEGVRLTESTSDTGIVLNRTLSHLPTGLSHVLLAPFPWDLRRPLDLLTVPEMLLWYAILVAAARSAWRRRAQWQTIAPVALFAAGTLALLALAEGNVGTLFRHRAMVIPFVIVLASPELIAVARNLRRTA